MVQINQLDLGQIMGNVQGIKSAQLQNQLGQQKLQANEMMMQKEAQFNPLLQNYLANPTPEAEQALFAADPQRGMEVIQQRHKLDQTKALQTYTIANAVANSDRPLELLKNGYPGAFDEFAGELLNMGYDINEMSPDQIKSMAKSIATEAGTMAGIDVQSENLKMAQARADLEATKVKTQDIRDARKVSIAELNEAAKKNNREEFKDVQGLRKEFTNVTSKLQEVQTNLNTINTVGARKDAAGDLALVVAFTKILDPGSVAREGEVALTQSATSVFERAKNYIPRLKEGNTLLPDDTRNQLIAAANDVGSQWQNVKKKRTEEYKQIGKTYFPDVDPSLYLVGSADPSANVPGNTSQSGDQQQASGPHGPKVVQNGVTYVWDAASGKYKAQE